MLGHGAAKGKGSAGAIGVFAALAPSLEMLILAPRPLSVANNRIFELPRTEQSKPAGNSRSPVKAGDLGVSVVNPFLLDACGNHDMFLAPRKL